MSRDPLEQIENLTRQTNDYLGTKTKSVFGKYPIIFSFLTVFGVVSVIYGFESFLAKIPFLSDRPLLIFLIGILLLTLTGSLYKVLDKKME